jgi:iron complex outermembrane recepter protein
MSKHQPAGATGPVATGVCLAIAAMSGTTAAMAQASGAGAARIIDEIVVTVRKIEERPQDVPLSIVVYDAVTIEREGLRRTEDIARLTPGVTFDRGAFPNDTRPAMRGMQTERGRPSVAVLVDGHDLSGANLALPGGSGTLNLALHDLERIEIVKGPQSTLYGRNAFAGAINYITRGPEFEFGGMAGVDVGNDGRREYRGSITGPLVEDRLAFRINAAQLESDGHYTNPVNGGPLGAEDSSGIAAALLFTPTAMLSITGRYQYIDREESDNPTAFIPRTPACRCLAPSRPAPPSPGRCPPPSRTWRWVSTRSPASRRPAWRCASTSPAGKWTGRARSAMCSTWAAGCRTTR